MNEIRTLIAVIVLALLPAIAVLTAAFHLGVVPTMSIMSTLAL